MFARLYLSSSVVQQRTIHQCTRRTFSRCAVWNYPRHEQALGGTSKATARKSSRSRDIDWDILGDLSEEEMKQFTKEDTELESSEDDSPDEGAERGQRDQAKPRDAPKNFQEWLWTTAQQFKDPSPRNWLGGTVPFPLNQSFKPPVPLSNALRTRLYQAYMADPQTNSVHALATKHNLSVKRVDAILRLKGMEEAWEKNKPIQTGFTKGMERLLGISELSDVTPMLEPDGDTPIQYYHTGPKPESPRYDVEEADRQDEIEGKDMSRLRYQRLFWESVAEGEEPVMPRILEAEKAAKQDSPKPRSVTIIEREDGRPAFKFVDVGLAFFDEKAQTRRDKEAARRSRVRAKKQEHESSHRRRM